MKKVIRKFIGNLFVRAVIKQIPQIGTPIAEMLTNIGTENGQPLKHKWTSIITQATISAVLIYLVASGTISIDEFISKLFFVSGK